jgi:hypothetical protein
MSCGVTSSRRWNPARPFILLGASAVPAFTAVHLRDHYGWEDTDAFVALGVTCGAAALLAGGVMLAWRRRADVALAFGLAAAALVVPVLVVYYFVRMALTADYS